MNSNGQLYTMQPSLRRPWRVAAVLVAAVLWVLPAVEQLRGGPDGNLALIASPLDSSRGDDTRSGKRAHV